VEMQTRRSKSKAAEEKSKSVEKKVKKSSPIKPETRRAKRGKPTSDNENQQEELDVDDKTEYVDEGDEQDTGDSESLLSNITSLMEEEGPTVTLVILRSGGIIEEKKVDMTPKLNKVGELLGGPGTFIGQFEEIQAVLMKLREPTEDTPVNTCKLPAPLDSEEVRGDIIVIRMDDNATPQDLTKEEVTAALQISEKPKGKKRKARK